jgi:AcrR family transcriptional regulator
VCDPDRVSSATARPGRRPGNQDTRGAILAAAREAFAARGFTGATVRGIAAAAGVDAALIHHYFDSKKALFLAVVELPVDPPALVAEVAAGGTDDLARRLLSTALRIWDGPDQPALVAAVRAAVSDPGLSRSLAEFLSLEVLGQVLQGPDLDPAEARRRAGLAASQLVGLLMGRYVLRLPALVDPPAEELVAAVAPVLQAYLDGEFPRLR